LQRLRATYLATVSRNGRIVGHVLWFKRTHFHTATRVGAAKAIYQQRFANIGTRALQHESGGRQNSMPF
jgi:hypothetical protein